MPEVRLRPQLVTLEAREVPASFTVNIADDLPDSLPGDGVVDIGVNTKKCSLRAAIQEANALAGQHTITFSVPPGEGDPPPPAILVISLDGALGALDTLTSDITITGPSRSAVVVVGGNPGVKGIFSVAADSICVIERITISAGHLGVGQGDGGGIINNGELRITDCEISNCTTAANGGGIANSGKLTVENSTFRSNSTGGRGGAIFNSNQATLTGCLFESNGANSRGGALCGLDTATTTISGSTFRTNSADVAGGAIYASGGKLDMLGGEVVDNTAGEGGGVFCQGTASATNVTFTGNKATTKAGAILAHVGSLTLQGCGFQDNECNVGGNGGVGPNIGYRGNVTFSISNCTGLTKDDPALIP